MVELLASAFKMDDSPVIYCILTELPYASVSNMGLLKDCPVAKA